MISSYFKIRKLTTRDQMVPLFSKGLIKVRYKVAKACLDAVSADFFLQEIGKICSFIINLIVQEYFLLHIKSPRSHCIFNYDNIFNINEHSIKKCLYIYILQRQITKTLFRTASNLLNKTIYIYVNNSKILNYKLSFLIFIFDQVEC